VLVRAVEVIMRRDDRRMCSAGIRLETFEQRQDTVAGLIEVRGFDSPLNVSAVFRHRKMDAADASAINAY
jgi:hypothetical protein